MLLLSALLPVIAFGVALLWSQWQRDREDLMLRLATSAQSTQNTFDDFLDGHLAGVRLLADEVAASTMPTQPTSSAAGGSPEPTPPTAPLAAPASADIDLELQRLLRAYPSLLRTIATDAGGRIVAARARNGPNTASPSVALPFSAAP
jgi:hypothetical protein